MKKINLWESKQKENFIFFTDIESYFKYLEDNNLDLYFVTKDSYNPKEEPESYLDNTALMSNLEITYTNQEHPIAIGTAGFTPSYVNPLFFKQHEKEFKDFALKRFEIKIKKNAVRIIIPDFIFDDNLLKIMIANEDTRNINYTYREFHTGYNLTDEQIDIIRKNHLEFILNRRALPNQNISSSRIIDYHTIKDVKELNHLTITLPITDEEIDNFIYLNDNIDITINASNIEKIDEKKHLNQLKHIFSKISKIKKTFNIKIEIENRELLRQNGLLNNIPKNINLIIENDLYEYNIETFNKEEEKLEALAKPIRESNLSPLEKYIAVYNIVKNFKPYKENEEDKEKSRYLRYILDDNNEYIVCVGYAKLLKELLDRVNIPCHSFHVDIDISREPDYNPEDKDLGGHQRNIIKIDDDKYNIHGYYIADSTWDNSQELDLYLNSLMTFDRKKEAKNLETLQSEDLLLDFHNFDDFQKKINFYLKREIRNRNDKDYNRKVAYSYRALFNNILNILKELDYNKYVYFYDKYKAYINSTVELNILEEKASNMLTEYATYIIPLSNQKISADTILKAATNTKKELYHYTDKQIKEWLEKAKKANQIFDRPSFPYKYDPNNQTEAYLTDYIEEETTAKKK